MIQTNFKLLGIDAAKRNDRFSAINLYAQFMVFQFLFFTGAYLLIQVESFREYADCFYDFWRLHQFFVRFEKYAKNVWIDRGNWEFYWRTIYFTNRKIHYLWNKLKVIEFSFFLRLENEASKAIYGELNAKLEKGSNWFVFGQYESFTSVFHFSEFRLEFLCLLYNWCWSRFPIEGLILLD